MKSILTLFLYLLCCSTLYSQVDSSDESFFPANIGNSWYYKYTQTQGYKTTLTRDSVVNGSRFLFFDSSNVPAYEIDSALNIFSNPLTGYRSLRYKLKAQKNLLWHVRDAVVAKVDDIYWTFILGTPTQVKKIGYYAAADTINFSGWFYDFYLAAGFGFCLELTDASQGPTAWLAGCIINGKTYGNMTYVGKEFGNNIPSLYRLYLAYPNPFNSSTVISYHLPVKSAVSVKVYDILGKEVSLLVNEKQERGFYKYNFIPKNLSSGMYLVRLVAGSSTQTTKIIYSK